MIETLNAAMERIESHPQFVLFDLMFHLVIVGHVIHHIVHASHRHLLPWWDRINWWLAEQWVRFTNRGVPEAPEVWEWKHQYTHIHIDGYGPVRIG